MKKLVFVALCAFVLASCGKYEEGPSLSLKSKAKRLCREWKIEKVFEEGVDITTQYRTMVNEHELMFIDYGSLKETIVTVAGGQVNTTVLAKGWEWGEKKETLKVSYKLLQIESEVIFTIRKLSSEEFWYTTILEEKNFEFHWVAK